MESKLVLTTSSAVEPGWPTDALDALKQDPAVLRAQIRVDNWDSPSPMYENRNLVYQKSFKEIENKGNETSGSQLFEDTVRLQKVAVLSLAPAQLGLLLKYAGVLRLQRFLNQKQLQVHSECAFCKKNGEPSTWCSSHRLKDKRGRVRCPVLREYRCPICGATGDWAHTLKYCPLNHSEIRWDC